MRLAANLPSSPRHTGRTSRTEDRSLQVRLERPSWDGPWRDFKMARIPHRRHVVRSGVMRDAIKTVLEYTESTGKEGELRQSIIDVLKTTIRDFSPGTESTNTLVDKFYSRLHNNHMNIYPGSGSYNQAIGTMAHGFERFSAGFIADLDKLTEPAAINKRAVKWLEDSLTYALLEYMYFNQQQTSSIKHAVSQAFDQNDPFTFSQTLKEKLDSLRLYSSPSENRGPMEIKELQNKQDIHGKIAELGLQMIHAATTDNNSVPELTTELKEIANILFDSTSFDISEASNLEIRRLQNSEGLKANEMFEALRVEPSIEGLKEAALLFLDMEVKGAEILGLPACYKSFFEPGENRKKFSRAIVSSNMPPSIESGEYYPKQIQKFTQIRHPLKRLSQQRGRWVSTTEARHAAWSIANAAFAMGKEDALYQVYRNLTKDQSISTLEDLQRAHFEVVNQFHNNGANIYMIDRGVHLARLNIDFALKDALADGSKKLQRMEKKPEKFKESIAILKRVVCISLESYLDLNPAESNQVAKIVSEAVDNHKNFDYILTTDLKEELALYSHDPAHKARYSRLDRDVYKGKIEEAIRLLTPFIKEAKEAISQQTPLEEVIISFSNRLRDTPEYPLPKGPLGVKFQEISAILTHIAKPQTPGKEFEKSLQDFEKAMTDMQKIGEMDAKVWAARNEKTFMENRV